MNIFIGSVALSSDFSNTRAICCSADGNLCVATKNGAYILKLDARARDRQKFLSAVKNVVAVPCDADSSTNESDFSSQQNCAADEQAEFVLDHSCNPELNATGHERGIRQARWSAADVDQCGGCLLAVLSYNHSVAIYGNTTGDSWDLTCNVSALWSARLRSTDRRDVIRSTDNSGSKFAKYKNSRFVQSPVAVCWSPVYSGRAIDGHSSANFCLLAVAMKSGHIVLWTVTCPVSDSSCFEVPQVLDTGTNLMTEIYFFTSTDNTVRLCYGTDSGTAFICTVDLSAEINGPLEVGDVTPLLEEEDCIAVDEFLWCDEIRLLAIAKGQYVVLVSLNVTSALPAVHSSHTQLVDTKFPLSGLSYTHPNLFVSTVEGRLYCCEPSPRDHDADVALDSVTVPWTISVPKNYGHGWLTGGTLMVLTESVLAYHCLPCQSKIHWLSFQTLEEIADHLLKYNGLLCDVTGALLYLKYCTIRGQPWPDVVQRFLADEKNSTSGVSEYQLKLLRFLKQLQLVYTDDKNTRCELEEQIAEISGKIMYRHVINAARKILVAQDLEISSEIERDIVSHLRDFCERRVCDVDRELMDEFVRFCDRRDITDRSETCAVCEEHVQFSDIASDGCKNGHKFSRCCQTLLLCQQVPYRVCSFCGALAISRLDDGPAWLRNLLDHRCTYCDGRLH